MVHKIIFAVGSVDNSAVQKFLNRIQNVGIQTRKVKSSDSYICFQSVWDDSNIPEIFIQNPRNAGAKLKQLRYNGKTVSCGFVYLLKCQKNLSNAEIGQIFNVSESTISRRIKKHSADGNFYENSKKIF